MADHLEYIGNYLQDFDRISTDTTVPLEPRWTESVRDLKWLMLKIAVVRQNPWWWWWLFLACEDFGGRFDK